MLSYTSYTIVEVDEAGVYAEVRVLRHEQPHYNPADMLPMRIKEVTQACNGYLHRLQSNGFTYNPTHLAKWVADTLRDVREVGVFNAGGCGVIVAVEPDVSI